jgi:hypothetical protein
MSEPLTDRQEAIISATAISLQNDSEDLPQHPQAAWGEVDEDYEPLNEQQVEQELKRYDQTDAAEDN